MQRDLTTANLESVIREIKVQLAQRPPAQKAADDREIEDGYRRLHLALWTMANRHSRQPEL